MYLASFPMYDLDEIRDASSSFWTGLRAHLEREGIEAPPTLTTPGDLYAHWRDPSLLLSQTCGYPYVRALREHVLLVATPSYGARFCSGPRYTSVIVVRRDDPAEELANLRGRRCAFNDPESHSGYNALRREIAPLASGRAFFSEVKPSGSHARSLLWVAEGKADVASIDCVTFALLQRHRPEVASAVRILQTTPLVPALPLVTHVRHRWLVPLLRRALVAALGDPELAEARRALLLEGFDVLDEGDYAVIAAMDSEATTLGYPALV